MGTKRDPLPNTTACFTMLTDPYGSCYPQYPFDTAISGPSQMNSVSLFEVSLFLETGLPITITVCNSFNTDREF